jgi:hypothetical protein
MQMSFKDTYLQMIQNSVGSKLFRNLYAEVDGQKKDILDDGNISCTFFVSSVLWHFKLLTEGPHANTPGFIRDLQKSGWSKTDTPKRGDLIKWESMMQKSGEHPHWGFYLDEHTAISHVDSERTPTQHSIDFGGARKIEEIYTHPFLA